MTTGSVGAVVVHHRRFPDVLDTIASVVASGVPAHQVWVIDTSEDPTITTALSEVAGPWRVHSIPNLGYGNAVNVGAALLDGCDEVLVVTHEVRLSKDTLNSMLAVLAGSSEIAAVGPDRLLADGRIWSRGGVLTPVLLIPKQLTSDEPMRPPARDVDWVDGACVLYRREVLLSQPFREEYFLYFEETELHTRLRRMGWRVVTAAGASAEQSTAGMPAFWAVRNTVLFQRAHGTRFSRAVTPPYFALRTAALCIFEGRWSQIVDIPKGLIAAGRRDPSGARP